MVRSLKIEDAAYRHLYLRAVEEDVSVQDLVSAIVENALDDDDFMDTVFEEWFPEGEGEEAEEGGD